MQANDAGPVLAYVGSFIAGGIVGALTALAAFRSSVAVLERSDKEQERQIGELRASADRTARDLNNVADKWRRELETVRGDVLRALARATPRRAAGADDDDGA